MNTELIEFLKEVANHEDVPLRLRLQAFQLAHEINSEHQREALKVSDIITNAKNMRRKF